MFNKKNIFSIFLAATFSLLFFSCRTTALVKDNLHENVFYVQIGNGIYLKNVTENAKTSYSIVKIDLKNPELKLNWTSLKEGWIFPENTKNFAKRTKSLAAINTTPFEIKKSFPKNKTLPVGIICENGKVKSNPQKKYGALVFYKANSELFCKIIEDQAEINKFSQKIVYACGGFWQSLKEGKDFNSFKDIKNCRTAVGTSQDESTLFILVGKNLSYSDCNKIFQKESVFDALQLDGGRSSQLVIKDKKIAGHIFNRKVCSSLGFTVEAQ